MNRASRKRSSERKGRRDRAARQGAKRAATRRRVDADESRGAIGVTVLWMLSALATLVAILGVVLSKLLAGGLVDSGPAADEPASLLVFLPGMLQFTGAVTGTLCLLLTVLAHLVRRHAPPRAVTLTAILLGITAYVAAAW